LISLLFRIEDPVTGARPTMGAGKVPAVLWLLLGAKLTFGVAVSPAQASRANHYDFFVSRSIYLLHSTYTCFKAASIRVFAPSSINGRLLAEQIESGRARMLACSIFVQQGSTCMHLQYATDKEAADQWRGN
jgi:hypothetical protein